MPMLAMIALAVQITTPGDPASAEAVAVTAPVTATFAALAARDSALPARHFDPEARMMAALERPDGTRSIRRLTGASSVGASQVETPTGVGGCVFLGISREMRVQTMAAYIDGGPAGIAAVPNLRRELSRPARRCSSGGDINSNDALLVAFMSTVIRSTNALKLNAIGLPQARLDAAWAQAPEVARADFLAHAQAYFDRQRPPEPSQPALDAMSASLGLPVRPSEETSGDLLHYFQAVALNELAEARLAVAD